MRTLYIVVILIPVALFAQLDQNMTLEKDLIRNKYKWENAYRQNIADKLTEQLFTDTTNFLRTGIRGNMFYQNSAVHPRWNYNDRFNIAAVPYIYGRGTKNLTFYMSVMFQNAKTDIVDNNKRYPGETRLGLWGDIELSKIQYRTKHIYIKFGRDYFMPGMYFHEDLLFSRHQYPYDQIYFSYRNNILNISTYYLRLNDMNISGTRYNRHMNGHRVSVNLFNNGYIAFNELVLYHGENRGIHPAFFNPFQVYYVYAMNDNIHGCNSMLSMDIFYHYKDYFIHGEFILDDFQYDHDVYGDLEPNEYGLNITLGKRNIIDDLHGDINYTKVSNRTYSAPLRQEYFVYDNLPIGHYMGSNLWEIKSSLSLIKPKYQGELQFIYRQSGDNVTYSDFNWDYLQGHNAGDPLPEGHVYHEPFPYISDGGEPSVFWGFKIDNYYQIIDYLGVNLKASYWFEPGILSSKFNVAFGVYTQF